MSYFGRGVMGVRHQGMEDRYLPLLDRYGLAGLDRAGLGVVRFDRGEMVLCEGERLRHLLIVIEGRARVCCQGEDGHWLLYGFYDGDGMLGEVELMLDCPATTTVEAVTPLTCLALSTALAPQLKASLTFMNLAARALAQKLRDSSYMRAAAALYPLRARLCAYIHMMAQAGYFEEKWTVLSELLGVSYRHLLRALDQLCRDGLLARQGRGVLVSDPAALKRAGGGCYAPPPARLTPEQTCP